MATVLVVRKPDRTVHVVPLSNRATLMAYNNRLPLGMRYKMEEMEEKEAIKIPFIDFNYVSATQAQGKVKELQAESVEDKNRIAELEEKLAFLMSQKTVKTDPKK